MIVSNSSRKEGIWALVAVVGLALGVTGFALADGGGTNRVHACVKKASPNKGATRILGPNSRCRSNERSVHWSVRGPAGAAGPTGSPGPSGSPGEIGNPGQPGEPGQDAFVTVLQGGNFTGTPPNDPRGCTVGAEWRECAVVQVAVPANKTYLLAIDSAGSFFAFNKTANVQVCTSVRPASETFEATPEDGIPASCQNVPTGVDISSEIKNIATNGLRSITGGATEGTTYIVSSAVRPTVGLDFCNGCDYTTIHTLVTVSDATP